MMPIESSARQRGQARLVRLLSISFLTTFALYGLLTLVGMTGTWFKLWISLCCAIPVNLYNAYVVPRMNRKH